MAHTRQLFTCKNTTTNATLLFIQHGLKQYSYGAVTYDTEANSRMRIDNTELAYSKTLFSEDSIIVFYIRFF
jgi:hypothetical protein